MTEYTASHLEGLEDRRVLRDLFIDLAQRLVDGFALDTESLIDVLTLKGNTTSSSADPVTALEKLHRDTVSRLLLLRGSLADLLDTASRPETSRAAIDLAKSIHPRRVSKIRPRPPLPY